MDEYGKKNIPLFEDYYRCYSFSSFPENKMKDHQNGGKIILPESVLEELIECGAEFPLMFKLTNRKKNISTHVGVLEFSRIEEKIFIPDWMITFLQIKEGCALDIESVVLKKGELIKIQPHSVNFLNLKNPKNILEYNLSKYSCLTVGDMITIKYGFDTYMLCVKETVPENAIYIIDCDLKVDFLEPVGYQEYLKNLKEAEELKKSEELKEAEELKKRIEWREARERAEKEKIAIAESKKFVLFSGKGNSLSVDKSEPVTNIPKKRTKGIGFPDYKYIPVNDTNIDTLCDSVKNVCIDET